MLTARFQRGCISFLPDIVLLDVYKRQIYQTAVFVKSVRPLHPGNYTVKMVHGMQDEKLTGLNDVGIRIEKQGE